VTAALATLPVLVGWTAVLCRLPTALRRWHEPLVRFFFLALLGLSLALTLDHPTSYRWVDRLCHLPNAANLLAYGTGLSAGWCAHAFLLHSGHSPATASRLTRRSRRVLLAVLAVMVGCFLVGPSHQPENPNFGTSHDPGLAAAGYWLAALTYVSFMLSQVARYCWRFARVADRLELRLGLQAMAVGAGLNLLHFGYQYGPYLFIPALHAGRRQPVGYSAAEALNWVALLGTALMMAGAVLPAWSRYLRLDQACRWLGRHRRHRQLRPLWAELTSQAAGSDTRPGLAGGVVSELVPRQLELLAGSRVSDIRDGLVALRPYASPESVAAARRHGQSRGLSGLELAAAVDAAAVRSALQARHGGKAPARVAADFGTAGGEDLDSELDYLVLVARHYAAAC